MAQKAEIKLARKRNSRSSVSHMDVEGQVEPPDKEKPCAPPHGSIKPIRDLWLKPEKLLGIRIPI